LAHEQQAGYEPSANRTAVFFGSSTHHRDWSASSILETDVTNQPKRIFLERRETWKAYFAASLEVGAGRFRRTSFTGYLSYFDY
jgi:hypothetical protein